MLLADDVFEDYDAQSGQASKTGGGNGGGPRKPVKQQHISHLASARQEKMNAQQEKMRQRMAKRGSLNMVGPVAPSAPFVNTNGAAPIPGLGGPVAPKVRGGPATPPSYYASLSHDGRSPSDSRRNKETMINENMNLSFDPSQAPRQQESVDMNDPFKFLQQPLPPNITLQCYITRIKGSGVNMHPRYELYLKENNEFMLTAKKRANNTTSNYLISMNKDELRKDGTGYLGKLRSNFLGTEFTLFDNGLNPQKNPSVLKKSVRKELAAVLYQSNILGSRGPRKMSILVPRLEDDGVPVEFRPPHTGTGLFPKFKNGELQDMTVLSNRAPKWNEQVGAYVLNFNGRVTMASVKNFQLIEEKDEDKILLQFGRVGKNKFTMDFMHPLTPTQAFAICLSSFDYKLACE